MDESHLGAPRTIQLIVHAKIFDLIEGWNEIDDGDHIFDFVNHAFNFDYLLHLSGINYLIHPDDIQQVIALTKANDHKTNNYHFRFINRTGDIKIIHGSGRLISHADLAGIDSM